MNSRKYEKSIQYLIYEDYRYYECYINNIMNNELKNKNMNLLQYNICVTNVFKQKEKEYIELSNNIKKNKIEKNKK